MSRAYFSLPRPLGVERPGCHRLPDTVEAQPALCLSVPSPEAMKPVGLRTILPSGPRGPLLHSVLRGGIFFHRRRCQEHTSPFLDLWASNVRGVIDSPTPWRLSPPSVCLCLLLKP